MSHASCAGQELRYDSWTLPQDARNRALLSAMVSPEPNMYSLSPAEYKPYYEEMAFAWLLSQAVSKRYKSVEIGLFAGPHFVV